MQQMFCYNFTGMINRSKIGKFGSRQNSGFEIIPEIITFLSQLIEVLLALKTRLFFFRESLKNNFLLAS